MIVKYYELTCDYCRAAIEHGIVSKEVTVATAKTRGAVVKGSHHFCDNECYQSWLKNGKKDFTQ